jgi:hypothetical protein
MSPMLAVTLNAKRKRTSICGLNSDYDEYDLISTKEINTIENQRSKGTSAIVRMRTVTRRSDGSMTSPR